MRELAGHHVTGDWSSADVVSFLAFWLKGETFICFSSPKRAAQCHSLRGTYYCMNSHSDARLATPAPCFQNVLIEVSWVCKGVPVILVTD